ncbi:MAG: hypothetical protein WBD51_17890, partial [Burkholderiaceae bacterium]
MLAVITTWHRTPWAGNDDRPAEFEISEILLLQSAAARAGSRLGGRCFDPDVWFLTVQLRNVGYCVKKYCKINVLQESCCSDV